MSVRVQMCVFLSIVLIIQPTAKRHSQFCDVNYVKINICFTSFECVCVCMCTQSIQNKQIALCTIGNGSSQFHSNRFESYTVYQLHYSQVNIYSFLLFSIISSSFGQNCLHTTFLTNFSIYFCIFSSNSGKANNYYARNMGRERCIEKERRHVHILLLFFCLFSFAALSHFSSLFLCSNCPNRLLLYTHIYIICCTLKPHYYYMYIVLYFRCGNREQEPCARS